MPFLRRLFETIDKDKSGFLRKEAFEQFLDVLLSFDAQVSIDFVFELFDAHGNGKLSLAEAQSMTAALVQLLSTLVTGILDVLEEVLSSREFVAYLMDEVLAVPFASLLHTKHEG